MSRGITPVTFDQHLAALCPLDDKPSHPVGWLMAERVAKDFEQVIDIFTSVSPGQENDGHNDHGVRLIGGADPRL